jgi:Family of unknown function (DUF6230)
MSQTFGKTRWRRFAVVMVPTLAVTAAVGVSVAQGALAASFSVSGQQFKVSADSLHGTGFTQYGTVDVQGNSKGATGAVAVAVSGFNSATIVNLCQSVALPTPIGTYTLTIHAGQDPSNPVTASKLFIDMTDLKTTTATFNNMNIGVADGTIAGTTGDAVNPKDNIGDGSGFAQEADSADLTGVQQTAWATSAGTFSLNGLNLHVASGDTGCF